MGTVTEPGTRRPDAAVVETSDQCPVPSLVNGRFEVLLWLGTSDQSSDFIGFDRVRRESVVVRIIDESLIKTPAARASLRNLFERIAVVDDAAVVPLVEWGRTAPTHGFASIYFAVTRPPDGPTIARLVEERGLIPQHRAEQLMSSLAGTVDRLRRGGVDPCALRADAMWIAKGGRVVVDPVTIALDIVCRDGRDGRGRGRDGLGRAAESDLPISAIAPQELRSAGLSSVLVEPEPEHEAVATHLGANGRVVRPRRLRRLVLPGATVMLAGISWFALAPPKWGGQTTYTVVAGRSMEPTFHTGDLVVLRRAGEYKVGDVVTYSVPEADYRTFNVVHRIVDRLKDGRFVIRGDNRNAADPWLVSTADIQGREWFVVANAGFVLVFLSSPLGFALIFGLLVTAWFWDSPLLKRRR